MTREQLIEIMARAIAGNIHECGDFGITGDDAYEVRREYFNAQAVSVLSAIEAAGLAVVPVLCTNDMLDAATEGDWDPHTVWNTMITAGKL